MENPLRILFADDEDSYRLVVANFLIGQGYVVEGVASGDDAVSALEKQQYDVIILDYKMPGMSGLNVLQWMLEQKNHTPVILLTGAGSECIAVEAMKLGAFDYILKEHIELAHLPIVINGVNERNLFRREKEERSNYLRGRENARGSIDSFKKALISLSHIANNSLSLLSLNLQEYIRDYVVPYQTKEVRARSETALGEIQNELKAIVSTLRAMHNLTSAMQDKIAGAASDTLADQSITLEVKARMAEHKDRMNE